MIDTDASYIKPTGKAIKVSPLGTCLLAATELPVNRCGLEVFGRGAAANSLSGVYPACILHDCQHHDAWVSCLSMLRFAPGYGLGSQDSELALATAVFALAHKSVHLTGI